MLLRWTVGYSDKVTIMAGASCSLPSCKFWTFNVNPCQNFMSYSKDLGSFQVGR